VPPRLPLRISALRCEYGGAVPGLSIYFDVASPAAITNLRVSSVMILVHGGWSFGIAGPRDIREWVGAPPGAPTALPRPLSSIAAGAPPIHVQIFGRLDLRAFGSGVTYPDRRAPFRAVLSADQGVLQIDGPPCVVTDAG
jgi:hypothetical protein